MIIIILSLILLICIVEVYSLLKEVKEKVEYLIRLTNSLRENQIKGA